MATSCRSPVVADSNWCEIGHPGDCRSVLDNLLPGASSVPQEHAAGLLQFGEIARRAAVPTLQAADMLRVSQRRAASRVGSQAAYATVHQLRSRPRCALHGGSQAARMGSLAWDVLGRDESLSALGRSGKTGSVAAAAPAPLIGVSDGPHCQCWRYISA
jgi:hypothetical protein